jgi:hypothetical protein
MPREPEPPTDAELESSDPEQFQDSEVYEGEASPSSGYSAHSPGGGPVNDVAEGESAYAEQARTGADFTDEAETSREGEAIVSSEEIYSEGDQVRTSDEEPTSENEAVSDVEAQEHKSKGSGGALAAIVRVLEVLLLIVSLTFMSLVAFSPIVNSFYLFSVTIAFLKETINFGVWAYCSSGPFAS